MGDDIYDNNLYDTTRVMKYVIDYAKDSNDQKDVSGMVYLGFGLAIIKHCLTIEMVYMMN